MSESHPRFRVADGVELAATLRVGRTSRRAILVVPGILTDRGCAEHVQLRESLADLADVVTVDVRGHGDSGGAFTFGHREPHDVADVGRQLRTRYASVDVVGFSFGGFHALVAAALEAGVFSRVASVAAPAHLGVLLDHLPSPLGLWRSLPFMARRRRRLTRLGVPRGLPLMPQAVVARIAPVPLLVAHGTHDWLVPVAHARRLHARAGAPSHLALVEGGLHAEYMLAAAPRALLDPLRDFLDG
jgi:pimeloyl-ACP methyl ester carboxylesterase